MNAQTNLPSLQVIAHHEAGHAVAGMVLGVEFTAVRIVRGEDGKIGVPLKTNPWIAPRPAFKPPDEFTDEEWAQLSQSDEKWEAWKKKDNDNYAIFCLAGKAAQLEYAGVANDEDAKADYSFKRAAHRGAAFHAQVHGRASRIRKNKEDRKERKPLDSEPESKA